MPKIASWRQSGVPRSISRIEVEALLAACDRRTTFGRRDYAAWVLMIRLGLRAGEVAALELGDVDWRAGEVVIRGKGNRTERLPLPSDVGDAVAGWIRRDRPRCDTRAVFTRVRAPHQALSVGGVGAIVRSAASRANLSGINAHRLRHTAATGMLAAGHSSRPSPISRYERSISNLWGSPLSATTDIVLPPLPPVFNVLSHPRTTLALCELDRWLGEVVVAPHVRRHAVLVREAKQHRHFTNVDEIVKIDKPSDISSVYTR